MEKYISVPIIGRVENVGNDYNKGFRRCKTEDLAAEITIISNDQDKKGYDLFSILPITQGEHVVVSNHGGWANSVTEGVILTFKRRD